MKKLSLILLFSLGALSAFAQQRITLDLQQTIALANDSSLEAFRTKNMYLAGYWEYRTYKANRLPSLTLNMTPAQYNRDITKRYDSEQDLDIYRSQQSFYAYGNLAVRQNFDLTGGTFYLDTELGYAELRWKQVYPVHQCSGSFGLLAESGRLQSFPLGTQD